jgi:hypothetical protein
LRYEKRREEQTIFLEAGFGTTDNPQKLKDAGFQVVCFAADFPHEHKNNISVTDPRIINHCYKKKYVLFTLDKSMRNTHVEVIKKTDVAIIATESCDKFSPAQWVAAFIAAKAVIKRRIKRFPRPWFAHLAIAGRIRKIETITQNMITRRVRPIEQEEA